MNLKNSTFLISDSANGKLGDNRSGIANPAVDRLKAIGAPAVFALEDGLASENEDVRKRSLSILESIDTPEAREVIPFSVKNGIIRLHKEKETSV